ncbi:MAG: energy-coupling factor ABC transporter ATP-binding protein [Thermostichus sp. DG_1_6_bins_120]
MEDVAIRVEHLTFAWPERPPVLQGCSFVIPTGQLWMLLGPNGSGKSTLLQLLSGSLTYPQPLCGHLQINGRLGYVFQNPDHQLFMPTVGADVAFGLGAEPLTLAEIRQRVETALEQVGLLSMIRRPIHSLSGGQKQRVAVAGALARRAQVLLLDEPTALLDPDSQADLLQCVRQLVDQERITALWVTHRLAELEWADGAIFLSEGQVRQQGSPQWVRQQIGQLFGT